MAASSRIILERLKRLHPQSIDLSLKRIQRLLVALDHPEKRLPPVIHVAGTNGKGSLIAFLRAIAEALGKRVQVYTSPHLVSFHERIVLPGPRGSQPISEDLLTDCLVRAEQANNGELITHFEITTAAALLAFADHPADLLFLETGLGGRLDATNVVAKPLATAITPISIDHVAFLGDSLSAIASEKAGILKPGVPCIVAAQDPDAFAVIEAKAKTVGAPLRVFGRDFNVTERKGGFTFRANGRSIELPLPVLKGRHQIINAATAIATTGVIFGGELTDAACVQGMTEVRWPARLERLGAGSFYAYVREGTEIWLDGAHNKSGGEVIAKAVAEFRSGDARQFHFVWGMMETKDAHAFIRPFKGLIERVYTVTIPHEANALSAEALAEIAITQSFEALPARSIRDALLMSQASSCRPVRVLICGSLYLAGHVLKLHVSPKRLPRPLQKNDFEHEMVSV